MRFTALVAPVFVMIASIAQSLAFGITVKLKAEFQGSNRDMYRPEAIVACSVK